MASGLPLSTSRSFGGALVPTSSSAVNTRPSQVAPKPVLDLPALQSASHVLQEQFAKDAQAIPDLAETLTTPGGQSSALYSVSPEDYLVPFSKRRHINIPEGLWQHYNNSSLNSYMGIIPELERVFITIDQSLFLWDYVEGQEISSFSEQPDVITHVAVVNPKPGVFVDEITHLLVICTPVSVLLIGVSSTSAPGPNNRAHKDIKMYATEMSISTDNIEMSNVVGTADGRIMMSGNQDGNLYELHYQETESWFGKRVKLINHSIGGVQSLLPKFSTTKSEERITAIVSDIPRNVFYVLYSNNTISVYSPTTNSQSVQHIQTLSNLFKSASEKAPGSPALTPQNFHIISMHVVGHGESRSGNGVQLVAITTNGIRLYFSPGSTFGYNYSYGNTSSTTGARQLTLTHVRLPPANLIHPDEQKNPYRPPVTPGYGALSHSAAPPTSRPYIISAIDNSCYSDGLLVAAQEGDIADRDFLLCVSPDLTRIGTLGQHQQHQPPNHQTQYSATSYGNGNVNQRPPLTEYATLLAIPGRTWSIASVPHVSSITTSSNSPTPVVTNELSTQFSEDPRSFMILTNAGLTFVVKRRALDYLRAAIEDLQKNGTVQPIIECRDTFGRDQTCAMLLGLASGNTFLDISGQSATGTISTVGSEITNVAKQAFYDFGERPMWTERVTYGTSDGSGTATFSGRREGFALYFARLVRPLWKSKLTRPGPLGMQESSINDDMLVNIQKNLYALKDFLDKNPHLFHSSPGEPGASRAPAGGDQEAWKAEQKSVGQLMSLLGRSIEAISFILLLNDYRLGELISQCDTEIQTLVSSMTFEDLITRQEGVNASRALVNIVIDQQIGQQIGVDTISEVLQSRCGSFCSTDDVMLYKARENVRKAVETRNPTERHNWLGESLRLFVKGARILEFDKIREICGDYQQLNYAKGAVELPLSCAQILDPDNVGLEHWLVGLPSNDLRKEFSDRRMQCYELVLDSLNVFEEKSSQAVGAGAMDDPETVRTHAYELAFASPDEMFHSTLYDWLINRGLADELLEMHPAYIEAHLRREPVTVQKYQLLWQFYVKDGQPLRAAEVLGALAESTEMDLSLDARLEYLTLAVGNAKSHPISAGGRHETAIAFLTDLEEKLDVAQVQLELYNSLVTHLNDPGEVGEKVKILSKTLLTMTEMYQLYAEPFDLPVMKLLILHVSEHREENLIRPIWNRIFEDALDHDADAQTNADNIIAKIVPLGQRFYPSEYAFPLRHVATLIVRFALTHKGVLAPGWAPRILVQCGVPYGEIWDVLHGMYESQIPPFNDQANVQAVSSDIAVLLADWLDAARRPQAAVARAEVPVGRIDAAIDQYLSELDGDPRRAETRAVYEGVKRQLRRNW
ncbi:hypothetical protein HWV62_23741 [Athelia sp. TMB]|nr:hypothetical protein HWV62_23741 [Athelia sp. TMB]